ncbi:Tol-Pal system protein TolQ [Paraburkholderia hiiakae]|uniref:Tol-Pal system protein TolQ n=1 Tax=Paraburkholderia hiiakae TaxID=1081782 RepID=A0ABM8NES7_9BURK|nr:MotA/TolQ/ExbB proton channel family protein [Paraburkholderia hiiakae]CAD6520772.1 Tol-Pal system protein TolQ [Paraburkholderia hiiakae]
MQDWTGIVQAARIGGWVVYPLTLLAIVALVITLDRGWVFWRFALIPAAAHKQADAAGEAALTAALVQLPRQHALRRLLEPLIGHPARPAWWIEARAGALALDVQRDMSRGLWVLETIVTAAPLLGLLGTIVGMMHAFRLIGNNGLVNPGGVTGGVAQALVATAIGLVIALVSLFAFNYFSRRIDGLMDELEAIASTWLSNVRLAQEHEAQTS